MSPRPPVPLRFFFRFAASTTEPDDENEGGAREEAPEGEAPRGEAPLESFASVSASASASSGEGGDALGARTPSAPPPPPPPLPLRTPRPRPWPWPYPPWPLFSPRRRTPPPPGRPARVLGVPPAHGLVVRPRDELAPVGGPRHAQDPPLVAATRRDQGRRLGRVPHASDAVCSAVAAVASPSPPPGPGRHATSQSAWRHCGADLATTPRAPTTAKPPSAETLATHPRRGEAASAARGCHRTAATRWRAHERATRPAVSKPRGSTHHRRGYIRGSRVGARRRTRRSTRARRTPPGAGRRRDPPRAR